MHWSSRRWWPRDRGVGRGWGCRCLFSPVYAPLTALVADNGEVCSLLLGEYCGVLRGWPAGTVMPLMMHHQIGIDHLFDAEGLQAVGKIIVIVCGCEIVLVDAADVKHRLEQ